MSTEAVQTAKAIADTAATVVATTGLWLILTKISIVVGIVAALLSGSWSAYRWYKEWKGQVVK